MESLTHTIRRLALAAGFEKIGITDATMPEKVQLLHAWLDAGYHGDMGWMERHRHLRTDIEEFFPGARSVISVAHNYYTNTRHPSDPSAGKISRYAWGRDYHKIIPGKLNAILKEIQRIDPQIAGRVCVDTAPFMDKLWAEKAGIGWQGKHTNLITREYGSWVFLGALIINKELVYDHPAADRCGSCTACIQACPTKAIMAPYQLDATRCIAYLTIEMRNRDIPDRYGPQMDNYIFGCDICQEVCPWNKFQKPTKCADYLPKSGNHWLNLKDMADITEEDFNERFKGTPLKRTGWMKFVANVKTVLKAQKI